MGTAPALKLDRLLEFPKVPGPAPLKGLVAVCGFTPAPKIVGADPCGLKLLPPPPPPNVLA